MKVVKVMKIVKVVTVVKVVIVGSDSIDNIDCRGLQIATTLKSNLSDTIFKNCSTIILRFPVK